MSENNTTTPNTAATQDATQQQGQLQTPLASNPAPNVNSAGENLQCQWQGCGERCPTAEALYEHVCERHVGRKSTNNLNLTCAWGQCRTTTVKRDHITSHIRVHVPLKPHKCEFCGKAFKRPQDLKKHVKTHADDSVIMRSPNLEPGGGQRSVQNGMGQGGHYNASYYGRGLTGQVPQNYYAPAMPGPHDYAAQQHPNQYYQPHPQVPTGGHPGYGPVTYYSTAPPTASYDFEARKRGFDALDHFFGQVRRREVDPINFHNVSRRLFELQGLQLPQIIPAAVPTPAYQPVAVGGGYGQEDPIQAYSLPPMGNAKTREDLTSIDQILEQMQATIYEQDAHLTAGVAPTGAGYVTYARASNSPPSTSHHGSAAAQANATSLLQHGHQESIASNTTDASTPGLTPPSSAQSYTSGQSPLPGHAAPTSSAMYPTLPASASDMAYAAANAATLSGLYDEDRRRWEGGRLQRAAPGKGRDDMDMASDGSATPPASGINAESKGKKRDSPVSSVIDPALDTADTPRESKDSPPDQTETWVQNMRLIEWMREFIKKKLETGDYDGATPEPAKDVTKTDVGEQDDTEMGGTDDHKEKTTDAEQLYPVLRHVEESA